MQERLQALMEDSGGKVGWGQGVRTPQQQLQLFLERHSPGSERNDHLERTRSTPRHTGVAAAVPPGRSMHEVGLAADLTGDFAWLGNNVGRFGLMTFADVNNEPWHVQPVELPKGRQQYEQQGSKWGAYPTYDTGSSDVPDGAARSPARRAGDRIGCGRATPRRRPSPRRWSPDPATPARRHGC